jgi:hypothetical protein
MEQFDKTFTYDLDTKQRFLVHGLINSDEYFKAIATKNSIEIMNCLSNMKTIYENTITKRKESEDVSEQQSLFALIEIYNKRYELGLYLACYMIDDEEMFEQIYLPILHYYFQRKKFVTKQVTDILQYLRKWNLTNIVIGHLDYDDNMYFDENVSLFKDIKIKEQSFQLVLLLQNLHHLKRKYKLKGGEL